MHRQTGRQDGQGTIFSASDQIAGGAVPPLPDIRFSASLWRRCLTPARLVFAFGVLLASLVLVVSPLQAAVPAFTGEGEVSTDTGHILLNWEADEPVTLQMARETDLSDARPLYAGMEKSYFLSGLADGDYYLQLKADSGAVSAPIKLSVVHQSLTQALWLTAIGLVITLLIVGTIVKGARDD